MIQEYKELLLIDLCARLPYGFIVHRYSDNADIKINDIDTFSHFLEYSEGEDFKPYLRPLSSMTEGEEIEFNSLMENTSSYFERALKELNWLNAHHFDYRGLIEKGLALEAPKEMYNTK